MVKKISRKISAQYQKYLRVWRLLKKPSVEEYKMISKVTAVGLLVLGAIGFAISILMEAII
jgi:protein translocase SEC61 complex gamma subunit